MLHPQWCYLCIIHYILNCWGFFNFFRMYVFCGFYINFSEYYKTFRLSNFNDLYTLHHYCLLSVLPQPLFSCKTALAFFLEQHVCSAPLSLSCNQFPDCFPTGRRHRKLSRTTKDRNGPRALLIIGVGHGSTHGLSSPPNTWLAKSVNITATKKARRWWGSISIAWSIERN